MSEFFENMLPKNQFSFEKGFSTPRCISLMLEKCGRGNVAKDKIFSTFPTNLSKVFDSQP